MLKPESLRQALTAALVDQGVRILERDPDKLRIYIQKGRIVSRLSAEPNFPNPGFEYRYELVATLIDFTGHPDAVMVTLLLWLSVHQPDLLQNHDRGNSGIVFEADIIDNKTVDLEIRLELSETVSASARQDGGFDLLHVPEAPVIPEYEGVPRWTPLRKVWLGDELIVDADG
ncbi:phage tail protein [Sphingosinicella sp. CPCC 101087]|uniref:phage tail protein n=1 Tax=Sphingosinicella sp. CPCC 101087 TaxID=2497754 RepID=UPI00101DA1C9|nr:phage tail protein [Sphingosinicella sp. CPCC 101087]